MTFRLPVVAAKLTYPCLLQKWVRFIFPLSHLFSSLRPYPQLFYYDLWMDLSRFSRGFIQKSTYASCGKVMSWEVAFLNGCADYPLCVLSPPRLRLAPIAADATTKIWVLFSQNLPE